MFLTLCPPATLTISYGMRTNPIRQPGIPRLGTETRPEELPDNERKTTATPRGPNPVIPVVLVPSEWLRADIICVPLTARPICPPAPAPGQTHKSPRAGGPLWVLAPDHVAQSRTTGPCVCPLYVPGL